MIFRRTKLNLSDQILQQWNKFRVWGKWNVPGCWLKYITSTLCVKENIS